MMVEAIHIPSTVHVTDAKIPACFHSSSRLHVGFAKRTNTICSYLSLKILGLRLPCILASGVKNAMLFRSAEAIALSIEATTTDVKAARTWGKAATLIAVMLSAVSSKEGLIFSTVRRTSILHSVAALVALPLSVSKVKSRLKRPRSTRTSLMLPSFLMMSKRGKLGRLGKMLSEWCNGQNLAEPSIGKGNQDLLYYRYMYLSYVIGWS